LVREWAGGMGKVVGKWRLEARKRYGEVRGEIGQRERRELVHPRNDRHALYPMWTLHGINGRTYAQGGVGAPTYCLCTLVNLTAYL